MTQLRNEPPRTPSISALARTATLGLATFAALGLVASAVLVGDGQARPSPDSRSTSPAVPKAARKPGASRATTVATLGPKRRVEEIDIRRAALALQSDPLRAKNPAAWRRMLLDRCIDRELLAMEAERRGYDKNPSLRARVADREYVILMREIYDRILIPGITPSREDLREIRASGLYRGIDLHYILIRDSPAGANRPLALRVLAAARAGARFDSLARIYSGHPPTMNTGGHFGWLLAKDLDPAAHKEIPSAKPGDILGLYTNAYGHEIYKIGAIDEPSDDSLFTVVRNERRRGVSTDYEKRLLTKYRFALDSAQVKPFLFTIASESPDSILASLGPDGTRPALGARPALGVIARCDGDSVTMRDLARVNPPRAERTGRWRIRDEAALHRVASLAVLRNLVLRDARERGIDRDPLVVREIRLFRDETQTIAMVKKDGPAPPDEAALRAYFEKRAERYRRPRAFTARVAVFAEPESASHALQAWSARGGSDLPDSLLAARRLTPFTRGVVDPTLLPRDTYAVMTLLEDGADPVSRAAAPLRPGAFAPVVRMPRGHAVVQAISVEEPRPSTYEEVSLRIRKDWHREMEDLWVADLLARLRSKTPVRVIPGRLDRIKLASATDARGAAR